jgi:hypothetical protein
MVTGSESVTIEGFVSDLAFVDRSKSINGILVDEGNKVASLTSRALSYFTEPAAFADRREPAARSINWTATTSPQLIIDEQVFESFVSVVNALPSSVPIGFFKLIDKLFFKYNPADTKASIESFLKADADIAAIYTAGSYKASSTILTDTVYLEGNTTRSIQVPAFITFEMTLPSGTSRRPFYVKLYTSVEAWLLTYNSSTIVKVIPPLPYEKIFNDNLRNTSDNIFATASLTTMLTYTSTQYLLGPVQISGIVEYKAVVTDGLYAVTVPFNIIYKGRPPTLFEIRTALKNDLLASGVASEQNWRKRIPGVFVTGRFYVVPLWDKTFTKPDQQLFPRILPYKSYMDVADTILSSLGYGDVSKYMDVLSLYYNRMSAIAIPDMSGLIDVAPLSSVIPDYQDYSPSDEQYAYMQEMSRQFASEINTVMTVDSGAKQTDVYGPNTEGLLSFYSFTIGSYEICVISKLCYDTIVGSTQ